MTGPRKVGFALALSATLAWASPARASDAVVDWNLIASNAIATAGAAGRPGPALFLDFAMVQAAVYDAVQAIEKRYQPYATEIPDACGSPAAATAKAAYDVLVKLRELIGRGYGDRILLSGDNGELVRMRRYGGWGFAHIPLHLVPLAVALGIEPRTIDSILRDNPRRMLTITRA